MIKKFKTNAGNEAGLSICPRLNLPQLWVSDGKFAFVSTLLSGWVDDENFLMAAADHLDAKIESYRSKSENKA